MKTIIITQNPVELYKILKFESLVYGGGEAKTVISGGLVSLNGEIETQKRKKVHDGDVIEFDGESFKVKFDADHQPVEHQSMSYAVDNATNKTHQAEAKPAEPAIKKPKRTAIRF